MVPAVVGLIGDIGNVGTCCHGRVLPCDWVTSSVNGITSLGVGFGISRTDIWLLSGMGGATLGFILIPALPCPILGFGIGGHVLVGGSWFVRGM